MISEKKVSLVCVGGVGETFFQFLENEAQLFNTLLLNRSDGITEQTDIGPKDFAKLIFV